MNRGDKPLQRRAGLVRRTPLKPSKPLERKPLRAVGGEPAAKKKARKPSKPTGETAARRYVGTRSDGWCEVRVPGKCDGRATDWQHRKNRSQRGKWRAANGLDACRSCHAHIHANPAESMRNGWTVPSWTDEEKTPVLLARPDGTRDWCLLDAEGNAHLAPWPEQNPTHPDDLEVPTPTEEGGAAA